MSLDWAKLAEPFPDELVKQRPGAATWEHRESCQKQRCRETRDPAKHIQFSYVDARDVAQRLDEVVTPAGWDFTSTVLPGTEVVHGRLVVGGAVREDYGYPNSDRDEEPIKAAASDALKRCAVLFGIGRHLYGDNKPGQRPAPRPTAVARPAAPPRTSTALPDIEEPDDLREAFGEPSNVRPFAPIGGGAQPNVGEECPKHPGEVWRGVVGDLYHKNPSGSGYCRPDGQPKRARA
jgi:hypothetical protein